MYRSVALALLVAVAVLVLAPSPCVGKGSRRYPPFARFRDPRTMVHPNVHRPARDSPSVSYEELYFEQVVDHYTFDVKADTYQQRYLISYDYWKGDGPVFFYAGNEGDIFMFWNNTGFLFELAEEFNALIIFAEHRYYGVSLPYGNSSFDQGKIRYLTAEQAMADYTILVPTIKANLKIPKSRVIVFGGSYGGMLASWLRMRYPNVFHGALAASAPIWQFQGQIERNGEAFSTICTRDYALSGPSCPLGIRAGFQEIERLIKSGDSGRQEVANKLHLCSPLKTVDDFYNLYYFLSNGYLYMAMTDYPSASDFLQPLPAWPVDVACSYYSPETTDLLTAMRLSVGVYYNSTGSESCFNIDQSISPSLGDDAWDYQSCTEMIMPVQTNGVTDMFLPELWNYQDIVDYCEESFNVTPRPEWTWVSFWGHQIEAASNIIFSNGMLDPWRAGGVTEDINDSVTAIVIEKGAHHLDLRTPDPADPQSAVDARDREREIIGEWLKQ